MDAMILVDTEEKVGNGMTDDGGGRVTEAPDGERRQAGERPEDRQQREIEATFSDRWSW